ncbi:MAG: flagellar biosynthetic protein FliR [Acidimicrobiia bacterium]
MQLSLQSDLLIGFLLALTRTSAWITITPPFNSNAIPLRIKIAIAAALSLPLASSLGAESRTFDTPALIGVIVYQVFAGVALGFIVYILFTLIQVAGELIDFQAGFSAASIYDPFSNAASTPFGRIYQLMAVTVLFAMNGHLLLIRGFFASYQAAPLSGPRVNDMSRLVTSDMTRFLVSAIEIASPLLAALFITELTLGLISKAAPQMNVMVIGFIVKTLVVFVLVALALPIIPNALDSIVDEAVRTMARLTR